MKTPPQPKAPRAKKLYAYPFEDGYVLTDVEPTKKDLKDGWCEPVFMLPRSKEAQEAMIEAGAKALWDHHRESLALDLPRALPNWRKLAAHAKEEWRKQARACFASANLVEKE